KDLVGRLVGYVGPVAARLGRGGLLVALGGLLLVALGAFGVGGLGFAGGFLVALGVLLALEFLAFAVAFVDLVVGAALRIGLGIVLVFVVVGGVGVLDLGVGDEVEVAQEFARRRRE